MANANVELRPYAPETIAQSTVVRSVIFDHEKSGPRGAADLQVSSTAMRPKAGLIPEPYDPQSPHRSALRIGRSGRTDPESMLN